MVGNQDFISSKVKTLKYFPHQFLIVRESAESESQPIFPGFTAFGYSVLFKRLLDDGSPPSCKKM